MCVNLEGGQECACRNGFTLLSDGKNCQGRLQQTNLELHYFNYYLSIDIDECEASNGGCGHNCTNLEGSYECSCREGYELNEDLLTCSDIDECSTDMASCDHTCVNLPGSFRCECNDGYVLDEDRTSCNGMIIVLELKI